MALATTLVLALCAFNFATALENEDIIGGKPVNPEDMHYKYYVSLRRPTILGWEHTCGGAIIGEQHVITAAHCVLDQMTNGFMRGPLAAIAGVFDFDEPEGAVANLVDKMSVPSMFNFEGFLGDLAVLRMLRPWNVTSNPHLAKVHLPAFPVYSYKGKEAIVTGYGYDTITTFNFPFKREFGARENSSVTYATAKVLSSAECQRHYDIKRRNISPTELCAQMIQPSKGFRGVCSGDSGGPLVYNEFTLIGVVSNSPFGCTEKERPASYTRLSLFKSFVDDAMADKVRKGMRVFEPNKKEEEKEDKKGEEKEEDSGSYEYFEEEFAGNLL